MAEEYKKLLTRISQRNNTLDGWARENPVLYAGELGFELDTYRVKHGDGVSHWLELPYWSNDGLTYTQGDGIVINNNVINATLLYEELSIPNVFTDE